MYKRRRMRSVPDTDVRPAKVCTPGYALKKAVCGVRLSRWELGAIADDPTMSFRYISLVVKGRWDLGEPAIMRSRLAVDYASQHVGGRWFEAEPYIMLDAEQALRYCVGIIRGRWEEAEETISRSYHIGLNYARDILKGPFPLWEARMIEFLCGGKPWGNCFSSRSEVVSEYMKIVRSRVPALESFLMERGSAACIYSYARGLGGRLPADLHQKMMVLSFDDKRSAWCRRYVRHLDRCRVRAERWISDLPERDRLELFSRYVEA